MTKIAPIKEIAETYTLQQQSEMESYKLTERGERRTMFTYIVAVIRERDWFPMTEFTVEAEYKEIEWGVDPQHGTEPALELVALNGYCDGENYENYNFTDKEVYDFLNIN